MDNLDALDPEGLDAAFEDRDWDDTAARYGEANARSEHFAGCLEEQRVRRTVLAAEELATLDGYRLRMEQETGATWTDPDSLDWRSFRAEVAALLQIHERSAESLLEFARLLRHRFVGTFEAFRSGDLSERHARIVVEEGAGISDEQVAEYEDRVLPFAVQLVPSRLEKLARKVRASLAPEAWYGSLLRAQDAIGAAAVVTGNAKQLLHQPGELRTLAQIEADVFRDLFLDGMGVQATLEGGEPVATSSAQRGVRPEVYVHVPVLTAMGQTEEPGELEGYGPIDAETARELAGTATGWIRLLTDPETATVLSFGQKVYKVPAALRRYLIVRDEVCRFVGCTRAAKYCDVDHTVPWCEDGETIASNLAHLCRGHHRLKGSARWRVAQDPGGIGVLTWTSWTGRRYTSEPAVKLPPPRRRGPVLSKLLSQTVWADDHSPAAPPAF
jgi:hypothetical protein